MATKKPRTVLYRRKREKRTSYSRRLKLLLSRKNRLVVRFTNQKVIAQLVKFDGVKGDKVLVGTDSFALKQHGWNYSLKNHPSAYLTGLLLGKKAIANGYKEAILDTGFKSALKKGKIYSFLKGVLDSGLEVPHGDGIFPSEETISGAHIQSYANTLKENNKEMYEKRFAKSIKNKSLPEEIVANFSKTKEKILG